MVSTLDGQAALVTGASSGLGRRFAHTLARAGAKVALTARRVDRLEQLAGEIEAFGGRALPIRLDVTDAMDVRACVGAAETALGSIDILVNNAGVAGPKWLIDTTEADYDFIMNTNLKGAWMVAMEVARRMIAQSRGGKIINIASIAGLRVSKQLALYAMSKAALIQMTKAMALEWARHGIQVNAIAPGYIETEMNAEYFRTDQGKAVIEAMPRRRIGRPEDLDGLLVLLASPASEFITGAVVPVDDGQSLG